MEINSNGPKSNRIYCALAPRMAEVPRSQRMVDMMLDRLSPAELTMFHSLGGQIPALMRGNVARDIERCQMELIGRSE